MNEPARQPKQTIRQLREARGWSQEHLARRLGVHQVTVSKWEHSVAVPRPRTLLRLADLFGVPVEAIAFGPADKQP